MATVILKPIVEIAITCLQISTLILLHTHRVNKNTKGNYFYLLTRNFWLDNYRTLWWFLFGRCVGLCSRDVWLEEDWKHEDRKILSCSFTGQLSKLLYSYRMLMIQFHPFLDGIKITKLLLIFTKKLYFISSSTINSNSSTQQIKFFNLNI